MDQPLTRPRGLRNDGDQEGGATLQYPEPRRPGTSPEARKAKAARYRQAYEAGLTVRELARSESYSYTGMHTLLVLAGTTFRRRGGAYFRRTRKKENDIQENT